MIGLPLDRPGGPDIGILSFAAGVAFSLAPALRATRAAPSDALKEQSRSVALSRSRLSRALIVAQVAVSLGGT